MPYKCIAGLAAWQTVCGGSYGRNKNGWRLPALLPEPAPQPTDCLVQPFADSPADRETVAKNVYLDLIAQAQRHAARFSALYALIKSK